MTDLARVPVESLEHLGIRLVVIGCAPHGFIKGVRKDLDFPHEIYCDPQKVVYGAFQFSRSMDLGRLSSIHVRTSVLRGLLDFAVAFFSNWRLQGDVSQQGGSLIVDNGGRVLYYHADGGTLDHAPINDLLQEVNVCPIDFKPKDSE